MKLMKLYIDSSVWNMNFDIHTPDLMAATSELFKSTASPNYQIYISEFVLFELRNAPAARLDKLRDLIDLIQPEILPVSDTALELASEYLNNKILPSSALVDAQHVAMATIFNLDVLVSWNYKHLTNINRREKVIQFNRTKGFYKTLQIVTPFEVIGNE